MTPPATNCPACERQDGDCCEGGPRTCLAAFNSARDAGIPLAVILGERTIRECFDQTTIDLMCGRESNES